MVRISWVLALNALPLISTFRGSLCPGCSKNRAAFHCVVSPIKGFHYERRISPLFLPLSVRGQRRKQTSRMGNDQVSKEAYPKNPEGLHIPVLLNEVLEAFEGKSLRIFIDGTVGLAGHSSAILNSHSESMKLHLGIDQDPNALKYASIRLSKYQNKTRLVHGNFGDIQRLALENGIECGTVDGILLDIGTSSMQLDEADRGFSFMRDGPLDMRMDPSGPLTAADIVNNWSEEDISKVLWDYGEERRSRSLARKIIEARELGRIETTHQLSHILGGPRTFNPYRKTGLHPATLTFQALRIAVNKELYVLDHALPQALKLLAPNGRLAVISFHSLEDRIVKVAFREAEGDAGRDHKNKYAQQPAAAEDLAAAAPFTVVTKRPVTASEAEMRSNPRSRSAKLRVLQRIR